MVTGIKRIGKLEYRNQLFAFHSPSFGLSIKRDKSDLIYKSDLG